MYRLEKGNKRNNKVGKIIKYKMFKLNLIDIETTINELMIKDIIEKYKYILNTFFFKKVLEFLEILPLNIILFI